MRTFQQKRDWKNIMYSRPVLAVFAVLLLVFAWAVFRLMSKMQVTRENRIMAENKVVELRQEKEKLSTDIAKLETAAGVEESIRDKFGWVKEGEGLIVIVEEKNAESEKNAGSEGFFQKIKAWFE